jgi:prepilin-type N-terminal cleavage/methylation domain-containing protein
MCIAPANARAHRRRRARRGAFTLLEITMAVAILAMMSLSIYRFVQANLTALRISAEQNVTDAQFTGFINLLSAEWSNLPSGVGAMQGEPLKLEDRSRDTITWHATAGPGLLTRYAEGQYLVSMRLRPVSDNSNAMEIGFTRTPNTKDGIDNETWVPLLRNVQSLQIRYFDPRLNVWVEKWTDAMTLPRLVKLQIGRLDNPVPWEVIVPLARTAL